MKVCRRCEIDKSDLDFNKTKRSIDGLQPYCRDCQRQIDKEHYHRNVDAIKKRKKYLSKKRYQENKARSDRLKTETPCKDCGKHFHPCQMQYDHLKDKKTNISDMLQSNSWETIQQEIAKCDIVCANCHCLRTFSRR